jgi:hypothetical protein
MKKLNKFYVKCLFLGAISMVSLGNAGSPGVGLVGNPGDNAPAFRDNAFSTHPFISGQVQNHPWMTPETAPQPSGPPAPYAQPSWEATQATTPPWITVETAPQPSGPPAPYVQFGQMQPVWEGQITPPGLETNWSSARMHSPGYEPYYDSAMPMDSQQDPGPWGGLGWILYQEPSSGLF